MGGWGLRFSKTLVHLNARKAPQEKVFQKNAAEVNITLQYVVILTAIGKKQLINVSLEVVAEFVISVLLLS